MLFTLAKSVVVYVQYENITQIFSLICVIKKKKKIQSHNLLGPHKPQNLRTLTEN